jgi:hypothetical protein
MTITILTAIARLDDSSAMNALIEPIPKGEQLRKVLSSRTSGRWKAYHNETHSARYVVSDGEVVMCFTVTDLTLEQATTIAIECKAITEWDPSAFQEAVERALGAPFDPVQ